MGGKPATGKKVERLQRQVNRLRNLLADAWLRGCAQATIRRIERDLKRRWDLLDTFALEPTRNRKHHTPV